MERQDPVNKKEVERVRKLIKKKEKEIKRMGKVVTKRQEKHLSKIPKVRKSKIAPKDVKKTKLILKAQPMVIERISTLKNKLRKLQNKKKSVLRKHTREVDGKKIIPANIRIVLRTLDTEMRNNRLEQNELISEFGLEAQPSP